MTQYGTSSEVQSEQLAQLLSFNTKTTVANIVLAVVLVYMLKSVLPAVVVLSWLSALFIINAIRFYIGRYFLKHPVTEPHLINTRINIFRIGLFLSASLWSVSCYLVYENGYIQHQLFIAFILAGLSAGTAVVYSIEILSALSVLIFAVLPMLIGFAFTDNPTLIAMSVVGAFYFIFVVSSIRTQNKRLIEGILLRFEAVNQAKEIKQLAFYDVLTGLPNRRLLLERLEHLLVSSKRTNKRSAILFIDLDNFKVLNDTLGHDKGDELLQQVAVRLKENVRESDTIARFGGDEFVLILENLPADYQVALLEVEKITQLILTGLNKPYDLGTIEYVSTPSIGVAFLEVHGKTQQDLLKHADIAMYHAKKSGRNRVSIYRDEMRKNVGSEK